MRYWEIIKGNIDKLNGDDAKMWASVEMVDALLEEMREHHPQRYWQMLRDTHELFYGKHFNKEYAEWEVERMYHKDKNGITHRGEHWSREQTNSVMAKYKSVLPSEVTPCDFYVALNAQWHDYCELMRELFANEEEVNNAIIEGAVRFWFLDEDWESADKVWVYFRSKNK